MESHCSRWYFLNQRPSLRLLTLVLTVVSHFPLTGSAQIQTKGEVGGNLTIHCPFAKDRKISFFYFQRRDTYVNGFHASRNLSEVAGLKTWNNTRVDHGTTTVHMYNLSISHNGDYQCLIQYNGSPDPVNTGVHISVTAKYSKPDITIKCSDGLGCMVKCDSHGGYPVTKMKWNIDTKMGTVVNSSENEDPDTKTVNSSSTAYFNCSRGELKFLSCYVGNVTSEVFSVCTPKEEEEIPSKHQIIVIAASCSVVFVICSIALYLLMRKCKKGQGGPAEDVSQEWKASGCEGEMVKLNKHNRNEEAP